MAYLNFQNCTRQEYEDTLYSQDAKNKIKILFNNVELENADLYCEKFTVKPRIIPNGAKVFSLNNFISKEAELILHDIDINAIQDQVTISIGTLVNNTYEYVPIGIFNIQDQPTTDKNKTTIKLRDNSVKFDFNYNAQTLIEANNGSATKLQILQDICTQANVTCNITSFIGYLDEIGVYDNTVTARQYIANIAEQAGKIATINRSGELIFIDLNNLTTWQIPIGVVEKYEEGTSFKIGKVVYEDGIVRYETADSNDDTLFLDGSNNYINGELVKEQASSSNNSYSLDSTGDNADLAKFELEGKTTQETRSGKNLFPIPETQTKNGITLTKNSNGTFNISGTATANAEFYVWLGQNNILSTGQQLSISNSVAGQNVYFQIATYNGTIASPTWVNTPFDTNNNQSKTLTQTTFGSLVRFNIHINNGQTVNLTNVKVQLEKGLTITTWEQYGVQPSPDYPSELVSVGYKNLLEPTLSINGTNIRTVNASILLNNDVFTFSATGTDMYFGQIIASGSAYGEYAGILIDVSNLSSIYYYLSNPLFTKNLITRYDENKISMGYAGLNSSQGMYTIPSGTKYISFRFGYGNAVVGTTYETKVMITKGTQVQSYIPYNKYGIEVKTIGKNLFDYEGFKKTYPSRTSGEPNNFYFSSNGNECKYYGNFEENTTYHISGDWTSTLSNGQVKIYYADSTEQAIMEDYSQSTSKSGTISVNTYSNKKIEYIRFITWGNGNYTLTNFQIEKGSQATSYEAYKGNSCVYTLDEPLRSIGTYKDKLYIKNNMLYVERKIGKVVLNGSESGWFLAQTNTNTMRFVNDSVISTKRAGNTAVNTFNNNYFQKYAGNGGIANIDTEGIAIRDNLNGFAIRMLISRVTNLAGFKTWLGTHNTEVDYVLATSVIEELGEITVPKTFANATNLDINSNIDTNSYIQYRKDKTQLEAILEEVDEFDIDSFKTGKILGNPAIDGYDLIQIHDKSKNILENNMTNQSINGLTFTKNSDGSILVNGTATAETNKTIISTIALNNTKQYTLSGTVGGDNSTYHLRVCTTGWGDNHYNYNGYDTFTPRDTANYQVMISIRNGTTLNNVLFKPMLVEGTQRIDYVPYKDEIYTTLATSDLTYNGVITNSFDTQIGQEAKEQNVTIKGEATFQKWARTQIDNVEGTINLQAGQINDANNRINETNLQISSQGALLNVIANNSNIDIQYDAEGNPLNGEVREVTTTTGFTFNAEGMTIQDSSSNFKAQHRNTGTYYKDGDNIVGQYTKDGSKQKDLELFGVYYYGKDDIDEDPMFVAQLFTDENGEEAFGHFFNRGD